MEKIEQFIWAIFLVTAACLTMIYIENVLQPVYVVKSAWKVLLFLGAVMLYSIITKKRMLSLPNKIKELKQACILALAVYALILFGFFFIQEYIDLNLIRESLLGKEGIHRGNFIFVAAYISIVNSFIEEIFFRGFAFQVVKHLNFQNFAHVFSACVFAIYHIGIIGAWFSVPMLILMIAGLFAAGIVLNLFCQYTDSILGSWSIHVAANLAINTIGFIIL